MRISLKYKIMGLVSVPLVASFIFASLYLQGDWKILKRTEEIVENGRLLEKNSELIHQVQTERAKTALFLGDKIGWEELQKQHKVVDEKRQALSQQLLKTKLEPSAAQGFQSFESKLLSFRDGVKAKQLSRSEATRTLTGLISELIQLNITAATDETLNGMEMSFLSLTMLEMGKEYGGQLRANILNVLSLGKPLSLQEVSALESLKTGMTVNLESPAMTISTGAKQKLAEFHQAKEWNGVLQTYSKVILEADKGNFSEDPQQFYQSITSALNLLGDIVKFEIGNVESKAASLYESTLRTFTITLVGMVCLLIAIAVLAAWVIRDLTATLQQTVGSLTNASHTISNGSAQLTSASQMVASGAVESASALEEVVASMEELNSIVAMNAQRAKEAAELSVSGKSAAEAGQRDVYSLATAMTEISQSSRKIEEIITVIDDIAFQTNLLALNASVEAARAGEQGKGFAVVAEAVRALAQRSAVAAKDISDLIKNSVHKIHDGSDKASACGNALTKIVTITSSIAQLNTEISTATSEQATGINQISKAINELDASTQQNASAAEQVSAFSDQMNTQTEGINSLVVGLSHLVSGGT
ncbi:methyl-accepting chemotaxis protein [Bdellovibrio sp. ArHS]|uniref:methyl-accepting chemotaxis protein n=1 Tax=Bdellovibrio sp. ArHS TaxID=1569284 RepID=UPI0025C5E5E0|nr:methyl-accepting chemotaxis protein [Bdellovibrio sp. ArHS]